MNEASISLFDICNYNRNLRDMLEYCVNANKHSVSAFEIRKKTLNSIFDKSTLLGHFFDFNKDKEPIAKFLERYKEFLDNVLVLDKPNGVLRAEKDNIIVDHAQINDIISGVINAGDMIRYVLYFRVDQIKKDNLYEKEIEEFIEVEEKFDCALKTFILLQYFYNAFMELQKSLNESKGEKTPQGNFIIDNDIKPLSSYINLICRTTRAKDAETRDLLEENMTFIDICNGRREIDDMNKIPSLFNQQIDAFRAYLNKYGPMYDKMFADRYNEVAKIFKERREKAKA